MLILTLRPDETITIGDDIKVTLTRIKGGQSVRLGIDAPKELNIKRPAVGRRRDPEQPSGRKPGP